MNSLKPIISIITPVYNAERYLKECIESVISQTNPDWELILVDDGSTDNSGAICDLYAQKDSRIRVIHKCNTGQFDTRMCGIREARGQYCTGLDADDYLDRVCIECLSDVVSKYNYDIVSWNLREVNNGNVIAEGKMERYGEFNCEDYLMYVIASSNHSFCNKLIKTELLKRSEFGNVPSNARHSEDFIMICPAICQAGSIIAIDKTLYNYRQIEGSVTHLYTGKRIIDYLESSMCIRAIMKRYSMSLPELEREEDIRLLDDVGFCLKRAVQTRQINHDESVMIRNHPAFKRACMYLNTKYVSRDIMALIILFRFKCDAFIPIIFRGRK